MYTYVNMYMYLYREKEREKDGTWPARRTNWLSTGAAFAGCDDVTRTYHTHQVMDSAPKVMSTMCP